MLSQDDLYDILIKRYNKTKVTRGLKHSYYRFTTVVTVRSQGAITNHVDLKGLINHYTILIDKAF